MLDELTLCVLAGEDPNCVLRVTLIGGNQYLIHAKCWDDYKLSFRGTNVDYNVDPIQHWACCDKCGGSFTPFSY